MQSILMTCNGNLCNVMNDCYYHYYLFMAQCLMCVWLAMCLVINDLWNDGNGMAVCKW